ncbi:MAG: GAF domain-containing protein [Anaerolineae bacterium]|jgi:PAS domain S-box-containing protein|nr:GAF domain-containing protein [Anaerolineae bacterium]MBT4309542.1 GAF domain-containing protein [Anaerolineae bacterium]MBT4458383.1 GAF domain-containing protein [Anaerolineae bacterium]MBT4841218.1 GAF domain-containing protein [Anaerolineae bacterium]MBT6321538.1 GAF domain-containing protein [Anaerolineae bacterium]
MENDNRSLLELLYHVSREVATALDLRTVLQRVLYEAIDNAGGERGSIIVMDDHGKPLDSIIVHGRQIQKDTTRQLRVTVERGLAGWVVRNEKPALVPDTSRDSRWLRRPDDAVQESGAKSAICVPLMAREKIVGVLTLVHPIPNVFDRGHLEIMQAIADQVGVAILNARLYTESQRQARVMTALADGAITINASLQMNDVFQRILNQTIQALQVETVALALKESPSGDFVFRAATGNQAGSILGKRVLAGEGLIAKVVKDRQGIVVPALRDDNPFATQSFSEGIDSHAVAMAPIQAQGKIIGVVEAINPTSGVFDPDALLVMTGIGSLAGTTIQNAQLFEQVEETQKRYRELFNDSIDPILITDWDGVILEANRKALSLTGYDAKTFQTMNVEDVHEVNWGSVGKGFEYLHDDHTASYEAILKVKAGEGVPVEVYLRNINFEDDQVIQWTFRDISERKALDVLRDDLTSMIYHDLRSPLSNVISSLEVLDNLLDDQDEATESLLSIASNSTARMQRLISSLLDINRLESGQPIATQQGVSPERLIHEALDAVSPSTKGRSQKLNISLQKNLPNIWVDGDMILRVLINLLENASKFTPAEGKIEVGAKRDGEWVQLWIADNGIGISPDNHTRIFEKFARTKRGEKIAGLGVGLAFCRLAVDGHGGKIWVDNGQKKGTRFNITLPTERIEQ